MSSSSSSDDDSIKGKFDFRRYKQKHKIKPLPETVEDIDHSDVEVDDELDDPDVRIEDVVARAAAKEAKRQKKLDKIATEQRKQLSESAGGSSSEFASPVVKKRDLRRRRSPDNLNDSMREKLRDESLDRRHKMVEDKLKKLLREANAPETIHDVEIVEDVEEEIIETNVPFDLSTPDLSFKKLVLWPSESIFREMILKYTAEAGYDDPNDITFIYTDGKKVEKLQFFKTPRQQGLIGKGIIEVIMVEKEGAKKVVRQEGDMRVRVNLPNGHTITESVLKSEPISAFKKRICDANSLDASKSVFRFDGDRLDDNDTIQAAIESAEMDEYDVLDLCCS